MPTLYNFLHLFTLLKVVRNEMLVSSLQVLILFGAKTTLQRRHVGGCVIVVHVIKPRLVDIVVHLGRLVQVGASVVDHFG